jgi:hypothetical protein
MPLPEFIMPANPVLKRVLGLRNQAHNVELVTLNGATRPVLGTRDPQDAEDERRRVNVVKQWGGAAEAPRHAPLNTILQALPQRSQTILSYEVGTAVRQSINGGFGNLADSRNHNQDAESVPVGAPIETSEWS